jgi:hypothetical protein
MRPTTARRIRRMPSEAVAATLPRVTASFSLGRVRMNRVWLNFRRIFQQPLDDVNGLPGTTGDKVRKQRHIRIGDVVIRNTTPAAIPNVILSQQVLLIQIVLRAIRCGSRPGGSVNSRATEMRGGWRADRTQITLPPSVPLTGPIGPDGCGGVGRVRGVGCDATRVGTRPGSRRRDDRTVQQWRTF